MKRIWLPVMLCFLLACSIQFEPAEPLAEPFDPCLYFASAPEWKTINFKSDLTIQVPQDFMGGISYFEGPIFTVYGGSGVLQYAFCGALHCTEYGKRLKDPSADTIFARKFDEAILLSHRHDLCGQDRVPMGIYYYDDDNSFGKLYWKTEENTYLESVEVFTHANQHETVKRILQTIKHK